jgi:hypothetical protein
MTGSRDRVIGVGRAAPPLPLPPNRTGGSPASGFPVGGALWGPKHAVPGLDERVESQRVEVGVWPSLMIRQTKPYASFHPLLEGLQHARAPHRWFDPRPTGADLSALRSLHGHWRRWAFLGCVAHAVTSLRPFAPRPLRRFPATMTALTPGPRGSSAPLSMNTARSRPRSPCFTCTAVDPVLSPPTCWRRPLAFTRYPSAADASRPVDRGLGFVGPSRTRHSSKPSRVRCLRTGISPPIASDPTSR